MRVVDEDLVGVGWSWAGGGRSRPSSCAACICHVPVGVLNGLRKVGRLFAVATTGSAIFLAVYEDIHIVVWVGDDCF